MKLTIGLLKEVRARLKNEENASRLTDEGLGDFYLNLDKNGSSLSKSQEIDLYTAFLRCPVHDEFEPDSNCETVMEQLGITPEIVRSADALLKEEGLDDLDDNLVFGDDGLLDEPTELESDDSELISDVSQNESFENSELQEEPANQQKEQPTVAQVMEEMQMQSTLGQKDLYNKAKEIRDSEEPSRTDLVASLACLTRRSEGRSWAEAFRHPFQSLKEWAMRRSLSSKLESDFKLSVEEIGREVREATEAFLENRANLTAQTDSKTVEEENPENESFMEKINEEFAKKETVAETQPIENTTVQKSMERE